MRGRNEEAGCLCGVAGGIRVTGFAGVAAKCEVSETDLAETDPVPC